MISRKNFYTLNLLLIVFLYFSLVPLGFDVYWHTVSYKLDGQAINHSYNILGVPLPRYFFLSYIYMAFAGLGVPLMWVVIVLSMIPILYYHYHISFSKNMKLHEMIILESLLFLCVFYSGLSLCLMYVIAYWQTRKRLLLIGVFMHPLGGVLYVASFIFHRSGLINVIMLGVFFSIFSYMFMEENITFKYTITLDNFENYQNLLMAKSRELIFLSILLFLTYIVFFPMKHLTFTYSWPIFLIFNYAVVLGLVMYTSGSINMIKNYKHPVIYLSWFDIGYSARERFAPGIRYYDALRR